MMCEWATAFGLALRMTRGTFKPRDGKPRDPNAPVEPACEAEAAPPDSPVPSNPAAPVPAVAAQIIDLNEVVHAGAAQPAPTPASTPAPNPAPQPILDARNNIDLGPPDAGVPEAPAARAVSVGGAGSKRGGHHA
jgi:hypothetical protein